MQYPEPEIDIDQTPSPAALKQEKSPKNPAQSSLNKLSGRLSIRQKIGWGYALAIGVAVLGTMAGQFVGENVYEKQARLEHDRAAQEEYLLNQLKISVLEVRSHQQQLIPLLGNPQQWQQERSLYLTLPPLKGMGFLNQRSHLTRPNYSGQARGAISSSVEISVCPTVFSNPNHAAKIFLAALRSRCSINPQD